MKKTKKTLINILKRNTPSTIKNYIIGKFFKSWYFKGDFDNWNQVAALSTGYDDKLILDKVLTATLLVKNGDAVFERDSVLFDEIQYSWPVLAGLMWCAAINNGQLRVLDYGGSLGSSYFQNIKFIKQIENLKWNIVEQEHYVYAGRKYIQDNIINFYSHIEECFEYNQVDLVLFSGVLDLIKESEVALRSVVQKKVSVIIIDRSAFIDQELDNGEDKFCLQVIPSNIFPAVLPYRHLSYKKIKKILEDGGYSVVETFPSVGGSGDGWEFRGLIATNEKI